MLKRNLLANYLGQGWVALMNFAFVPVYIHLLGIEAYGVIGLFSVLQAWLVLLDMGMTPTLSREIARFTGGEGNAEDIRDLLRTVEIVAFAVAMAITSGVWVASDWLSTSWLHSNAIPPDQLARAFSVMGLVTSLRFVEGIYRGCMLGLQHQVLLNGVSAIMATVRGAGAVAVLMLLSSSLQAFFMWQALVSILTILALAISTYRSLPATRRAGRFSLAALKSVWRFAAGMLGISVLSLLLTQVDKVLLSRLLPLREYGYYMLASMAASSLYVLIAPITQAWFPRLAQLHASGDIDGLKKLFHQGSQLISVLAGSVAIVVAVYARPVLELWTGQPKLASYTAPILSLLVLGNLLNGLMNMPYQAQLAYRWTSLGVQINAVAACLVIPAMLWIAPRYGPIGAAWVWLGLNAGYVLVGIHLMFRRILIGQKIRWYMSDNISPLLSASLVALSLRWAVSLTTPTRLLEVLILGVSSALTLFAALMAASEMRSRAAGMIAVLVPTAWTSTRSADSAARN